MGTILEQLPSGARVAAIRLRWLGDCVLMTPALEALMRSRPDLRVTVVVEERFKPIFEGNPDPDALVAPSLRELAGCRPDLCSNLRGGTRGAVLTMLSGTRFRAGFAHHRYSTAYNVRIPTAQQIRGVSRKVHTAEHLASAPSKTWPAERFLEVAARLQDTWRLEPVFIAGAGEDVSRFGASDPDVWAPWRTASEVPIARGGIGGTAVREVLAALDRPRAAA